MNTIWKSIIIDDEYLARERLKRLLNAFQEFDIIGEAENGAVGIGKIESLRPDIIFLDIEMPVLNGFEMLAQLKYMPKVIFTTAYDHYAIKAFEEDSIDYLLKPVEAARLEKTIIKLHKTDIKSYQFPLDELLHQLQLKKTIKTLTVKLGDKILLIKIDDIIYIDAEDKYVFLHTADEKTHLTDYTLLNLEDKLPEQFARIHRAKIINTDFIKEIRKSFNGVLVFILNNSGQTRISSSRSYGDALRKRFSI